MQCSLCSLHNGNFHCQYGRCLRASQQIYANQKFLNSSCFVLCIFSTVQVSHFLLNSKTNKSVKYFPPRIFAKCAEQSLGRLILICTVLFLTCEKHYQTCQDFGSSASPAVLEPTSTANNAAKINCLPEITSSPQTNYLRNVET